MLTSKQRAYLRGLANSAETILQVGKEGISENLIKQVDDALTARELIKGKVLETAPGFAGEIAAQLAEATGSRGGTGDRNALYPVSPEPEESEDQPEKGRCPLSDG